MGFFDGVAEVYEKARHAYPAELRDHLVEIGALRPDSFVVDLGAGTGQLALLASDIAADVVAVDPEPDMVRVGRQVTGDRLGIRWVIGSDCDIGDVTDQPIDLVLIGNAFHHMNQVALLRDLDSVVAPSGFVVVCSSSIPVWLQDADWSAALLEALVEELGRPVGVGGTPDHVSDMAVLSASAFSVVRQWSIERQVPRSADSIVGEVMSSAAGLLGDGAADRLGRSLQPFVSAGLLTENVKTTAITATRPS